MSEYSVESLQHLILSQHASTSVEAIAALRAFQERIKADEGAVTDAVVQRAVQAFAESLLAQRESGGSAHHKDMRAALLAVWPSPPAQAEQVDHRVAIRLAQYGAEYADRHKDWSLASLLGGCEEHIDSWIAQASDAHTAEPAAQGELDAVERAAKAMWEVVPRGVPWSDEVTSADDWRMLARAALAAQPRAVPAERVVEDSALIPRHYASNIGYAACMMESSQSVLDRREAPILRKIAALLAAAPSPGES